MLNYRYKSCKFVVYSSHLLCSISDLSYFAYFVVFFLTCSPLNYIMEAKVIQRMALPLHIQRIESVLNLNPYLSEIEKDLNQPTHFVTMLVVAYPSDIMYKVQFTCGFFIIETTMMYKTNHTRQSLKKLLYHFITVSIFLTLLQRDNGSR